MMSVKVKNVRYNELLKKIDMNRLPKHIAVIMDGNGRWAKERGIPHVMGHRAGGESAKEIIRTCGDLGIKVLTLYAFSTENWKRPAIEIKALMHLLVHTLKKEINDLVKNNVRLQVIGRPEAFPEKVTRVLDSSIARTEKCSGLVLNLALNYGSRQEIVEAVNTALKNKIERVDEEQFSRYLYTADLPDPDLLIRTSGEMRISNFLLWQLAYTELIFSPVYWPAFRKQQLAEAILEFQRRQRRFGGI